MRSSRSRARTKGWLVVLVVSGLAFLSLGAAQFAQAGTAQPSQDEPRTDSSVLFIENRGQYDRRVRFHARLGQEMLWFTEEGIWISRFGDNADSIPIFDLANQPFARPQGRSAPVSNIKLSLKGADDLLKIVPFAEMSTTLTAGTAQGPISTTAWSGIRYENVSEGLDILIFGEEGHWHWRLISTGPDSPETLSLEVTGVYSATSKEDTVDLKTRSGVVSLPELTFQRNGTIHRIRYQVLPPSGNLLTLRLDLLEGVSIGESISSASIGDIAPKHDEHSSDLFYSTYFGSDAWDQGDSIALDSHGNAYATGYTQAITFTAKTGPIQGLHGIDVFVFKLNELGNEIDYFLWFYTTALNAEDYGKGIAVDDQGDAYVTGRTHSPDFCSFFGDVPGWDTTYNGDGDAYLMKIDASGEALEFCTFLGGNDLETGNDLAVDADGNSYLTGGTWSADFPTSPGAYDRQHNGLRDVFITKVDSSGLSLVYSSFLGGSGQEEGVAIDAVSTGEALITGWTSSEDFDTTPEAFDTSFNGGTWDAFVAKVNVDGDGVPYSTYLGGSEEDRGLAIAARNSAVPTIAGMTRSNDFPTTPGAFDRIIGAGDCGPELCSDGFVTRFENQGDELQYSTYLGGELDDTIYSLEIDGLGRAYVTGKTISAATFPTTTNAYDKSHNGAADAFVSTVGVMGEALSYSSYLGGLMEDSGAGITIGQEDKVYLTGRTQSENFPTTAGSFDPVFNGDNDAFVTALVIPVTSRVYLPLIAR